MTPGIEEHVAHLLDKVKSAVVSCEMHRHAAAYGDTGRYVATGLIIDKKRGIVLTNRHVASILVLGDYYVTFLNGRQVQAHYIYDDPTRDFAFLYVDPKDLPEDVPDLEIYNEDLNLNETVLLLGNNQARGFSMQYGIVSDKYESKGVMIPMQAYRLSLNAAGGSSGSGIFDMEGRVRALMCAGETEQTHAFVIPIKYISDALRYVERGEIPPRQECGALFRYYPMDKVVRFDHMDPEVSRDYVIKYPDCFNKAIMVSVVLDGTPAEEKLMTGDVIHMINGKVVGPSIYDLQTIQDNWDLRKSCIYTVYRGENL